MFPDQTTQLNVKTQDPGPCQACQIARKISAKFCPECGRNLTLKEPEPVKATALPSTTQAEPITTQAAVDKPKSPDKCGKCKFEISPKAQFCSQCGKEVEQESSCNIVCKCKDNTELTASMTTEEFVIGQAEDCNLVIPDGYVSRHHTRLFLSDGKLMLEDMGSSNGTFVRIHEPVPLTPKDEILIGTNILKIKA